MAEAVYHPTDEAAESAWINRKDYAQLYQQSLDDPDGGIGSFPRPFTVISGIFGTTNPFLPGAEFWASQAETLLSWSSKWNTGPVCKQVEYLSHAYGYDDS